MAIIYCIGTKWCLFKLEKIQYCIFWRIIQYEQEMALSIVKQLSYN